MIHFCGESEKALLNVEKNISSELTLGETGKIIEDTIKSCGFNPVANLSGHSLEEFDLHAGISIPNVDNKSKTKFGNGHYAIEPFATNGNGKIHDGEKGNIFMWISDRQTRNPNARKILEFIKYTFGPMPFASRWIIEEFGKLAIISLRQLEQEGILHHYAILTEEKGKLVSQAENTFLINNDEVIVTTK